MPIDNPSWQLKAEALTLETPGKTLVENICFDLPKGEITALIGESGSGKSLTALSILGLLPSASVKQTAGTLQYNSQNQILELNLLSPEQRRKLRGGSMSMVFQEPMTALNPSMRCGEQVAEVLAIHKPILSKEARKNKVLSLFEEVELPRVNQIYEAYPHQLSGGQKQRIMIAMALVAEPQLIIADEPTTALDSHVQAAVIELLKRQQKLKSLSVLFITHNLHLAQQIAQHVIVMYQGKIVEKGPIQQVFNNPKHSYTQGLLACRPSFPRRIPLPTVGQFLLGQKATYHLETMAERHLKQHKLYEAKPVLIVKQLNKSFAAPKAWFKPQVWVRAVQDVSFELYPGEVLGVIGESGCGKSTLSRMLMGLIPPDSGTMQIGETHFEAAKNNWWKRQIQLVFQDPYSALDPNQSVGDALSEVLLVHKQCSNKRDAASHVERLLQKVGLDPSTAQKFPHAFSGGQRQRIVIARALAASPRILICDESVAALDVSVQAQIINLLRQIIASEKLSCIFISHDLAIVRYISDRIMVMHQGSITEIAEADELFEHPKSAYATALFKNIYKHES